MAVDYPVETRKLSVTTTDNYADLGGPPVDALYLHTDEATVTVDFDRATDATSFLLPADTVVEFDLPCNRLHFVASGGTANLYMIAVRRNK